MPHLRPTVSEALLNVQVHDHVCLLYETPEEQFQTALPFLKAGLDKHDYCIYVADENTTQTVMERMRRENLDVDTAVASGQLALLTKRESFLRNGAFHANQMIEFLKEGCAQAKAHGFSACRGTGEMTWHFDSGVSIHELLSYEAQLNDFYRFHDAIGICQYNVNRFSPEVVRGMIQTHPIVVYKNTVCRNSYYIPPDEWLNDEKDTVRQVKRLLAHLVEREQAEAELRKTLKKLEASQSQLQDKINDLEKFEDVVIGRELKMAELEKEISELRAERLNLTSPPHRAH
jgi:two-component system, chemotaxis family, sensor kinase Cph1